MYPYRQTEYTACSIREGLLGQKKNRKKTDFFAQGVAETKNVLTFALLETTRYCSGTFWPVRLAVQDAALSRRKHGFDSRTGHKN